MSLRYRIELPTTPEAPRLARQHVSQVLRQQTVGKTESERALLVVSELVTNAVVHARGPIVLELGLDQQRLRLTVFDGAPVAEEVHVRHPDTRNGGGLGLHLVDQLASSWQTEARADGKAVEAEIELPHPNDGEDDSWP